MTDAAIAAPWPALDRVLAALSAAPWRTGSVIATVYGDAILPRGGSLAVRDLLLLMRRLGAADGVVRTALSRLSKDGLLQGRRTGRRSAYALTPKAEAEFRAAVPQIYGPLATQWDGRLHLAFPDMGADRLGLEAVGFALLAPGILVAPRPAPSGVPWLEARGPAATLQAIAARAWPLGRLREQYEAFIEVVETLGDPTDPAPLDAMAARVMLIHAWRRIALRDPRLPGGLLPPDWPSGRARELCTRVYASVAAASERWLDAASGGVEPLPGGVDPRSRFH